jgi:acetyl esterase
MSLWLAFERAAALRVLALPKRVLRAAFGAPPRSPEGYVLELQSHAMLGLMRLTGERALDHVEPVLSRRRLEHAARVLEARPTAALFTRDVEIPGGAGPRRARVYRPAEIAAERMPALLWFHGGGFVLGSIESHDSVCRALASQARLAVVAVDYRLAPEHRFPAGLDDAIATTRWVLEHGGTLGVDSNAVAIGGDSAGGNLAAVTAQTLRGSKPALVFQLLVYPATDATRREPSHRYFREGFVLSEANVVWFLDHYLGDPALAPDPRVSPLFAPDLSGLPPALVLTAGFDPLRDEGRAYAERMRGAGVAVEYNCSEGSMHGFMNTAGGLVESARLMTVAADRLRDAVGGAAATGAMAPRPAR